jgi:hypothetical protein
MALLVYLARMKIGSLLAAFVLVSALVVGAFGCVIENVPTQAPAASSSAPPPAPSPAK